MRPATSRLASFMLLLAAAPSSSPASSAPQQKTVLAWIGGNMSAIAEFVLHGEGEGAVNAVSHTSVFRIQANATDAQFTTDPVALAELAVGEIVILMAPPCTFSRCFNSDKQGLSSK